MIEVLAVSLKEVFLAFLLLIHYPLERQFGFGELSTYPAWPLQ